MKIKNYMQKIKIWKMKVNAHECNVQDRFVCDHEIHEWTILWCRTIWNGLNWEEKLESHQTTK